MTYFMTYIDSNGVKHTVHEIPEAQLKSTILSLQSQGASDIRLWSSVDLLVVADVAFVGRELP